MHPQEVVAHLSLQCCFKVQVLKGATEGVKIRVRGQVTGCLVAPVHQCKLNPASTLHPLGKKCFACGRTKSAQFI